MLHSKTCAANDKNEFQNQFENILSYFNAIK